MAFLLAAWSALFYGVADFCGGFAARRSALLPTLVLGQFMGGLVALVAALTFIHGQPTGRDLAWGAAAGLTGTFGMFMLYGGLAHSVVAIVSPTSAMVGTLLPVAFGLFLGERPPTLAVVGALLCLPAILMLTWEGQGARHDRRESRTALGYGLASGLGFGCFFICVSRAHPGSGLWPLLAARTASLTACVIGMLATRQRFRAARGGLVPAMLSGSTDMAANIMFLVATQTGMLSLVTVITALYPAPTVILARFFMNQKLPPVRLAGLVLAIAGVALISVR
jgi:drug/metabolite transporter (DMT)-like permease